MSLSNYGLSRFIGEYVGPPNITNEPVDGSNAISEPTSGTWQVPTGDSYIAYRGHPAREMLRLDTLAGSLILGIYVDIPDPVAAVTCIWDVSSYDDVTAGVCGYSLRINASEEVEVVWKNVGQAPALRAPILTEDPLSTHIFYRGVDGGVGTKPDRVFHFGVVINRYDDDWVDLYIDGSLVASEELVAARLGDINPLSGMTLWGTCRDPADNDMIELMPNTWKTSSLFLQRLKGDKRHLIPKILQELQYDRMNLSGQASNL